MFGLKKKYFGLKNKGQHTKRKEKEGWSRTAAWKTGNRKEKEVCSTEKKKKKKKRLKQKKGAEQRGLNREFFSIYFPSNLLRKIMVNSFMLNLIFSMN